MSGAVTELSDQQHIAPDCYLAYYLYQMPDSPELATVLFLFDEALILLVKRV